MTDLNSMWAALEKYQPYAKRCGLGKEWLRMTTERTVEAAECVEVAADTRVPAWAAHAAASAVVWAEAENGVEVKMWTTRAIRHITRAIERKSKETA